jgi:hypothetical protein
MAAAGLATPVPCKAGRSNRLLVEPSARHRDAVLTEFRAEDHLRLVLRALRTEEMEAGGVRGRALGRTDGPHEPVSLYGAPHVQDQQFELERKLLAEMLAASDRQLVRTANAWRRKPDELSCMTAETSSRWHTSA